MRGPSASVRFIAGLIAIGTMVACTRPFESDAERITRVTRWLADLEGSAATADKAAAALATLGPADAVAIPTLMAALSCPTAPAAEPTHGERDEPRDHDPHDHDHGTCNDHIVLAAAAGLGAIGAAAVEPLLVRIRADDEPNRTFASYALARMRIDALPALMKALSDPEPRIRLAVIGSIRSMERPPSVALPAIAARLTDIDLDVRIQATDALGHFGSAAVPSIVSALDDADSGVRASAASALRLIGKPARDRAPVLRAHLTDIAASVRLNAAAALAAVGADDPETVDALAGALTDPDHTVRAGAATALGRIGKPAASARPALEKACSDENPLVRLAANLTVEGLIELGF